MEDQKDNQMSPNYVPEEFRIPYDIIELPSQGILYKNKIISMSGVVRLYLALTQ